MADKALRHVAEDGSIYAAEIRPPEADRYGAQYHVDLVRASRDGYGLEREQRLTLGQHNSWMEAEEQLGEVEAALAREGLAGLSEAAQGIVDQPYGDAVRYVALLLPPDAGPQAEVEASVIALKPDDIAFAPFAAGQRQEIEPLVARLDGVQARDGDIGMLDAARALALEQRLVAPGHPLFGGDAAPGLPAASSVERWALIHHVDGGGTAHWFGLVEREEAQGEPYELRYFRALELDDGAFKSDSYPVMPLPADDPALAWPLPGLAMYLKKGDVYMAQQFAHDVADAYGQDFPDPLELPALDPRPSYSFGYGIGPRNAPSLEAVKTWMDGAERRFDTLTVGEYGMFEEAGVDERELETLLAEQGVEAALNLAERMAVSGGYLGPKRGDPRVFFADDAPPDPFTTVREREMSSDMQYSFDYNRFGDDALALEAHKAWREPGGTERGDFILLDLQAGDSGGQTMERFEAEVARLTAMQETSGLEAAMNEAERQALANGLLDGERADPRLFTQGPPDPFTTIRERELARELETLPDVTEMDTELLEGVTIESEAPGDPALYRRFAEDAARERTANAGLEGTAWFEATFEQSATDLLQPLDDSVNYAVVVEEADPWTLELAVEKCWKEPGGYLGVDSLTLNTYDPDEGREQAEREREALLAVCDGRRLEAMMHQAELAAMQNGWLDGGRADPRLFTQGPPDRFETLAQRLEGEINPYWNTEGERIEDPASQRGVENPYWRLETLPVNDPDGEPLGHALHIVVYPGLARDPEQVGAPHIPPQ